MPKQHKQGDSTPVVYPPAPQKYAIFMMFNSNGEVRYLTTDGTWSNTTGNAKRMTLLQAQQEAALSNTRLTGSNHYHRRGVCTL